MFIQRLVRMLRKSRDPVAKMGCKGGSDLSRETLFAAMQITCTFAFVLLLYPKAPPVAGRLGGCKDRDKELGVGGWW